MLVSGWTEGIQRFTRFRIVAGTMPLPQFIGCRESEPVDFSGEALLYAGCGQYIQLKKGTKHVGNATGLPEMQVQDE
jgi:hypothetical protein